jgi:hypothetical protein
MLIAALYWLCPWAKKWADRFFLSLSPQFPILQTRNLNPTKHSHFSRYHDYGVWQPESELRLV